MFETAGLVLLSSSVAWLVGLLGLPLAAAWTCGVAHLLRSRLSSGSSYSSGSSRSSRAADSSRRAHEPPSSRARSSSVVAKARDAGRVRATNPTRRVVRFVVAANTALVVLAAVALVVALRRGEGQLTLQHLGSLARLGPFDLPFDLALDRVSAVVVLSISVVSLAVHLPAWSEREPAFGTMAWTNLSTFAAIVVALADGIPVMCAALALSTVATWVLSRTSDARVLFAAVGADVGVFVGGVVLFWSLGGSFDAAGFVADARPSFVLVELPERTFDDKAWLRFDARADAAVSAEDGPPLPGEPWHAPFVIPLEPGEHSFEIDGGPTAGEQLVRRVHLVAGRNYALVPFGPTVSFRDLADQFSIARPGAAGPTPLRALLARRTFGGVRILTVIAALWAFAVLARLSSLVARGAPTSTSAAGGLAFVLPAACCLMLALRTAMFIDVPLAPVLASLSALVAMLFALQAFTTKSASGALRSVLAGTLAMAFAAVAVGQPSCAMVVASSAMLGVASLTAFGRRVARSGDDRWAGVAVVAVVGLVPGAGVNAGVVGLLAGAMSLPSAFRVVVTAALAIAVFVQSLVVVRVYDSFVASSNEAAENGTTATAGVTGAFHRARRIVRATPAVLAALALLGGIVLGVGSDVLGGHTASFAARILPPMADLAPSLGVSRGAFALAWLLPLSAWCAARRPPPPLRRLLGRLERGTTITVLLDALGRSLFGGLSVLSFLARSASIMDREVVEDVVDAGGRTVLVFARALRTLDRRAGKLVSDLSSKVVSTGSAWRPLASLAARVPFDDPRWFVRARRTVIFGMVILLSLVVLLSILDGFSR